MIAERDSAAARTSGDQGLGIYGFSTGKSICPMSLERRQQRRVLSMSNDTAQNSDFSVCVS